MSSDSFKNFINRMFTNTIYLIYMHKEDLTLNNQQRLMCQKPIQTKPGIIKNKKVEI